MLRIVLALGLALTPGAALACTCAPDTGTPADHLADHEIVFWGEVISRGAGDWVGCRPPNAGDTVEVEIQVLEPFAEAELGETIVVRTFRDSAACGVPFDVGERWLVFAEPDQPVSLCGPSHLAAEDDRELQALREIVGAR